MMQRLLIKLILTLLIGLTLPVLAATSTRAQEKRGGLDVQRGRDERIGARGKKTYYDKRWNLDDLPQYKPEQNVSGTIRVWGSGYFAQGNLGKYWEEGFRKYHPEIKFDFHLKAPALGIPALCVGMADIAPSRHITFDETLMFERVFSRDPIEITMVTGSLNVAGWNYALGIFVNKNNPLTKLTIEQLDGIFGTERDGAYDGTTWRTELARGPEKNIRTWGQLGLTGEWADKPIHVYGYNLQFHFPQEIESRAFGGVSGKWNENLVEYDNLLQPDGSFKLAGQLMLEDLAKDPYGIAYCAGGNAWLTPQIKAIALSIKDGGPHYELTLDNVRNRTYPMYADVFFYIDRDPKKPVDLKVKEFLRYVLSSEGQAQVMRDGKYLPLTAEVVRAQLKLLD